MVSTTGFRSFFFFFYFFRAMPPCASHTSGLLRNQRIGQKKGHLTTGLSSVSEPQQSHPTCVVLLNYTLPRCTEYLWNQAEIRVCADGGASRLRALENFDNCLPPHFVIGDLDSVTEDTLALFESKGATVVNLSHDQDTTDLEKCYRVVRERVLTKRDAKQGEKEEADEPIFLVLGAFGGQWDREMSNLNVMMKHEEFRSVLVGDDSIARLLLPGVNEIRMDFELEGPGCSLIPLGQPCRVTTKGLKWDLTDAELRFGGLVSTSNVAEQRKVVVETDKPLIWNSDSNLS